MVWIVVTLPKNNETKRKINCFLERCTKLSYPVQVTCLIKLIFRYRVYSRINSVPHLDR